MRKFWKIFGITIGSLLGVTLIAVCAVIYIVFTPKRLTPIVRNVTDQYISCPHEVGEVELTFFSTFPDFGLRIDGIYLVNPMEGAPSDTVLAIPEAVVIVNPVKLLREQTLDVRKVLLTDTRANVFVNATGESNADVFILSADTVAETDTSTFALPFRQLNIDQLKATIEQADYLSQKDSTHIRLDNVALNANAGSWDDINACISVGGVYAAIGTETYADGLQCALTLNHTACNIDSMAVQLRDATVSVNEFAIHLAGNISLQEDIAIALDIATNEWQVPDLLALLPSSAATLLDGIATESGQLSLQAHVEGIYNDSVMPVADATLQLKEGAGNCKALLPYDVKEIALSADAHIDLNDSLASNITINQLKAKAKETSVEVTGTISEATADMLCDLRMKLHLHLPDLLPLLPEETRQQVSATGNIDGTLQGKIRLSDLMAMRLQKGNICGNIRCQDLEATYDSLFVNAQDLAFNFQLPNRKPRHKQTNWLTATLQTNGIRCNMSALQAATGQTTLQIETSDIFSPVLYAAGTLQSRQIDAKADSMEARIQAPDLTLYAEYDTKDTAHIPVLNARLAFNDLQGSYADNKAHLTRSEATAALSGSKRNKAQPRLKLTLATDALNANAGEDIQLQTKQISITANARRNPAYENILLQWNPKLTVQLTDGILNMASFKETIQIPAIDFDYSNRVCHITDSRIIVGKSDFALSGEIDNIGQWLKNEAVLTGELNFVSDHTDVNELMLLTSSDTGSEETAAADNTETTTESQPYLVPNTVDLTLNTLIKEVDIFDQTATNLGGKLYVKNGILVLEEMGFICNAARLQLTAMYKTPRRNHLYLGLDYHMLDINIEELVNMIPQIDSMVPMLRSFRGNAEFHLAAETYLNSKYQLKTSTTRGACSISGKDLVLLDNETFGKIAKILMFNKKTENKVDSISAEITLFKNEIDIYPFCLSIDNYMAAVGGRHNLDMTFDYHISLLKPLYLGVDVSGSFDDLKIKLAKCRYAQDFRPVFRRETDKQNAELRKVIKASLQKNVKQ